MQTFNDKLISVVLPVFNEEAGIDQTLAALKTYVAARPEHYELIFVDDGSTDRTAELIRQGMQSDPALKLIRFSRNFGHQLAISAGIRYASGDAVVVMDGDLQDPPNVIPLMLEKWQQGYAVVYGKRRAREGETWFKKTTASLFYRTLRMITTIEIPVDTGDFRLMDRQVVNVLKKMNETDPFVRGMVSWVGFKQTAVLYDRQERLAGQSKYPLRKMLNLAMNGITSFSKVPLVIGTWLSGLFFLMFLVTLIVSLASQSGTAGIISALFFCSSFILLAIGLIGSYVGRIFDSSRGRPLYIVSETAGFAQSQIKYSSMSAVQ